MFTYLEVIVSCIESVSSKHGTDQVSIFYIHFDSLISEKMRTKIIKDQESCRDKDKIIYFAFPTKMQGDIIAEKFE